jgi:hypothetical protein
VSHLSGLLILAGLVAIFIEGWPWIMIPMALAWVALAPTRKPKPAPIISRTTPAERQP